MTDYPDDFKQSMIDHQHQSLMLGTVTYEKTGLEPATAEGWMGWVDAGRGAVMLSILETRDLIQPDQRCIQVPYHRVISIEYPVQIR